MAKALQFFHMYTRARLIAGRVGPMIGPEVPAPSVAVPVHSATLSHFQSLIVYCKLLYL